MSEEKQEPKDIRVKLVSNGFPAGSKLIDAHTGKKITGVRRVTCDLDARNGIAPLIVEFVTYDLDIESAMIPRISINGTRSIVPCDCDASWNVGHSEMCALLIGARAISEEARLA